jgi:hypothetical protein
MIRFLQRRGVARAEKAFLLLRESRDEERGVLPRGLEGGDYVLDRPLCRPFIAQIQ